MASATQTPDVDAPELPLARRQAAFAALMVRRLEESGFTTSRHGKAWDWISVRRGEEAIAFRVYGRRQRAAPSGPLASAVLTGELVLKIKVLPSNATVAEFRDGERLLEDRVSYLVGRFEQVAAQVAGWNLTRGVPRRPMALAFA